MRFIWLLLGIIFLYFALQVAGILPQVAAFFTVMPWWMYLVIAGILFSGYKVFEGIMEDRRADQEHIEKEGQVYLERMEEERRKRKEVSG